MGCIQIKAQAAKPKGEEIVAGANTYKPGAPIQPPKPFKQNPPVSRAQLQRMRDEFWDTQPHYGGQPEIWQALKATTEVDRDMKLQIIESAGIIVQSADMTVCYDERGVKYDLPPYLLALPTNLLPDSVDALPVSPGSTARGQQV
mmetsp:Transcript_43850/g.82012  ORF Transcript_43850/g.82012 Transcript_43850/m.82012 type:complete len:145 (-) Transcript_43850:691-1125(-)